MWRTVLDSLKQFSSWRGRRYKVQIGESHVAEAEVAEWTVYVVRYGAHDKWAYLRCPCPAHDVIRLNLSASQRPRWTVRAGGDRIADIDPSIWQHDGCRSHFIIRDGRVRWVRGIR